LPSQGVPQLLRAPPQRPVQSGVQLLPELLPPLLDELSLLLLPLELDELLLELEALLEVEPLLLLELLLELETVPVLLLDDPGFDDPLLDALLLLDLPEVPPPLLELELLLDLVEVPLLLLDTPLLSLLLPVPLLPVVEVPEPELVAGSLPGEKQVPATHCWSLGQSALVEQLKMPEGRLCKQPADRRTAPSAPESRNRGIRLPQQVLPMAQVVPPQHMKVPSVPHAVPLGRQPQTPQLVWQVPGLAGASLGQQTSPAVQQSAVTVHASPVAAAEQHVPPLLQPPPQQSPAPVQWFPFGWQQAAVAVEPPLHRAGLGPLWQQLAALPLHSCPLVWQQMLTVPFPLVLGLQSLLQQSSLPLQPLPMVSQQMPFVGLQSCMQQSALLVHVVVEEFGRQQATPASQTCPVPQQMFPPQQSPAPPAQLPPPPQAAEQSPEQLAQTPAASQ
jgi:hypothetical protein